jgi:hypothetical protein
MTGVSEAFVNDLGRYVREFTSLSICRLLSHRREVALHLVDTHRDAAHGESDFRSVCRART